MMSKPPFLIVLLTLSSIKSQHPVDILGLLRVPLDIFQGVAVLLNQIIEAHPGQLSLSHQIFAFLQGLKIVKLGIDNMSG